MKNASTALLFLSAALLATSAPAATVTSTADSGPGSLRQAIASAAPGETITFSVAGTITLTSGELLVDKDLTISGPGAGSLAIQRSTNGATPAFRVFNLQPPGIITISGLTVNNGLDDLGGGINNETTSALRDCVVTGNSAVSIGGGINNFSTLLLSNCVVGGNSAGSSTEAGFGGGVGNTGTMTAMRCLVTNNSAVGGPGLIGIGGGIYSAGTLAITNSAVSGNSALGGADSSFANGNGGGIYNDGTLVLDTTTVAANSAVGGNGVLDGGGPGFGGGLANGFGTVTLNRSTVSANFAVGGASTNRVGADARGGGLYNDQGTIVVENSTVSGNLTRGGAGTGGAGFSGGAGLFNVLGSLAVSNSTVTANVTVPGGSPLAGAGLFNAAGVVGLKNTILAGDAAPNDFSSGPTGLIKSGGFNLIGTTNGPITPGPNDQFNLSAAALRLGPLQDNGGPTFTHALLCGSPAINAGDNTGAPPTDQRGFPRIVGGMIDIGSFEYNNSAPTITCSGAITSNCAPPTGKMLTLSANVADVDGDPLVVVWTADGKAYQTNVVAAAGPPTTARVDFTAVFAVGTHVVTVSVSDPSECVATCSTTVSVAALGNLYPIALHDQTLAGVPVGGILFDIYNGVQPGNFGWLTWAGSPSERTLVTSLTPPGNSGTYINPQNPSDHFISIGDWVQGKPGVSNSQAVRRALNTLEHIDIIVPVWDQAVGKGNNSLYRVSAFAKVRIINYRLPQQNRITARFLGLVPCD